MQATAEHIDYKLLYEQQAQIINGLNATIDSLKLQIIKLAKMLNGSKHERFVATDDNKTNPQLALELDADTIAACKITDTTKVEYIRTKTEVIHKPLAHPGRMKLPENIRRETTVLLPDCDVSGLKKIGDDITEILDFTPGELFVKQYIRPKYLACRQAGVQPLTDTYNTVITASLPERIMTKCMAGEGLLSQIIVDKYVDHLPLHRQLQRFERTGITIAQSTINDWVKAVLNHVAALYDAHKRVVLACGYLHADETTIKVQMMIRKTKHTWAFIGYITTAKTKQFYSITEKEEGAKDRVKY